MSQIVFYVSTLIVFLFIYNIMTWGLNIQFGYAGILNFTYITFMAVGAYFAGVTALAPPTVSSEMHYIFGWSLPYPIPLFAGGVAAGILGLLVGLVALKRLRSDYLAIVTVAVGTIVWDLAGNDTALFNGWDGIAGVPSPMHYIGLPPNSYSLFYIVLSGVVMGILWIIANRIYFSPYGRTLRAIRESEDVAAAFGKNVYRYRMTAMIVGSIYAGIAGALLMGYVGAFNPSGWTTGETFIIWAALIMGGKGNNLGSVVGALLVAVIFTEATRYLPAVPGHPGLISAVRNIFIGGLMILTLWVRPQGIIPEPKFRLTVKVPEGPPGGEARVAGD